MNRINSKRDLELVVDRLISGGYQYLIEGGLDVTERIRPRLVSLLADVGHRRGFRYTEDWGPFFGEYNLTHLANDIGDTIQGEGFQFVTVPQQGGDDLLYPLESEDEIEAAKAALREAGIVEAEVWYTYGTFDELCNGEAETVKTRLRLIANDLPRDRFPEDSCEDIPPSWRHCRLEGSEAEGEGTV